MCATCLNIEARALGHVHRGQQSKLADSWGVLSKTVRPVDGAGGACGMIRSPPRVLRPVPVCVRERVSCVYRTYRAWPLFVA
jgi:hypothetical protein